MSKVRYADDDDLMRRAWAAYFQYSGGLSPAQPSRRNCSIEEVKGKTYIALRNNSDLLAAYRVRNDGMLKRLKRWPAELEVC